jgi:hypothetical protein
MYFCLLEKSGSDLAVFGILNSHNCRLAHSRMLRETFFYFMRVDIFAALQTVSSKTCAFLERYPETHL